MIKEFLYKIKANHGVIALEFSFIYIIFIGFIFIIFEACKIIFIITSMEYSLSEAARRSAYIENKTTSANYTEVFKEHFFKQSVFWDFFIDPSAIKIEASFCSTVNELLRNRCSSVYNEHKRLALYSVSYKYLPLKAIKGYKWSESLYTSLDSYLTRKVVYVIESSRSK